ncbi:hypothetical protein LQZ18_02005 [Lachnospiraceae bacterium ZAX-1]
MTDKEWMKFESTGKITDYLKYQEKQNTETKQEKTRWGVKEYGANRSADGHGAISGTYRGI